MKVQRRKPYLEVGNLESNAGTAYVLDLKPAKKMDENWNGMKYVKRCRMWVNQIRIAVRSD